MYKRRLWEKGKVSRWTLNECVSAEESCGAHVVRGDCGGDREVIDCVLVPVFDLAASLDSARDTFFCFVAEFSTKWKR